jgi:hypothetical protein
VKTLDTFDFAAADGVNATQIHTLARGEWVTAPENLILAGPIRYRQNPSRDRARRRGDEAETARALYPLHKARIDHIAGFLVAQRYLDVVVADHLREWLRVTTYFDTKGVPLPSSVYASDVQAYIAQRPGGRSAPRLRFVRASARVSLLHSIRRSSDVLANGRYSVIEAGKIYRSDPPRRRSSAACTISGEPCAAPLPGLLRLL